MGLMLPFIVGAAAVWYGMLGRRPACFLLWLAALILFGVAAYPYVAAPLPFVL
ncbi:hypothetical protein [Bordetella genomosp. 13]|uniref:hypothetical protein n=1 Tax=Bordetella genomosp. 13 TaxID=463040 RepID=UPI001642B5DD|nr:hypothetical protein [Bordetella genomosp. 13]